MDVEVEFIDIAVAGDWQDWEMDKVDWLYDSSFFKGEVVTLTGNVGDWLRAQGHSGQFTISAGSKCVLVMKPRLAMMFKLAWQ